MQHINLYNIKLNQIRIFLTAVECNSFTAAAEYLNMTQPMVSKTINSLENEFGIILFIREHGKLQLTPAGRELYLRWKSIIEYFEGSLSAASDIQKGTATRLVLGLGSLSNDEDMSRRIKKTEAECGISEIIVEKNDMVTLLEQLADGRLDAAVVSKHLMRQIQRRNLSWKVIIESNLAVFVSKENPLSQRDTISFSDLRSQGFISYSTDSDPQYLELLDSLAAGAGFVPRIAAYVTNESAFRINLLLNQGVVLADSTSGLEGERIKKFVLEDHPNNVLLVWKESPASDTLSRFVKVF